jgi:hypothetical protein
MILIIECFRNFETKNRNFIYVTRTYMLMNTNRVNQKRKEMMSE